MRSALRIAARLRRLGAVSLALVPLASVSAEDGSEEGGQKDLHAPMIVESDANVDALTRITFAPGLSEDERFAASMKTTDLGSSEKWCSARPSEGSGCEADDGHNFTPKNIGNVFCLPISAEEEDFRITESCQDLLDEGKNRGCKPNENVGKNACETGALRVGPVCSWRTPQQGVVEWDWSLSRSDGQWVVDCGQRGYEGPTYIGGSEEDEVATVSGCLGHGRLMALEFGEHPKRPCRFNETRISIEVESRQQP